MASDSTHDDLDRLLRGAMKTLDDQVPSGYFDGLPKQTLLRLSNSPTGGEAGGHDVSEAAVMQTTTTGTDRSNELAQPLTGSLEMKPSDEKRADPEIESPADEATDSIPRAEDSGLHDIRSLAQSTKQRMSAKVTVPHSADDDLIASSSTGWKAVALPEPARMISLPELAELPSKKEMKELKKSPAQAPIADEAIASVTPISAAAEKKAKGVVAAPTPASSTPLIGSRIAAQKSGGNGKLFAVVGLGLAAAAGLTIFVVTRNSGTAEAPRPVVASIEKVPAPKAPVEEKAAEPAKPEAAIEEPPKTEVPAATAGSADVATKIAKAKPATKEASKDAPEKADKVEAKVAKPGEPAKKLNPDGSEPSFDDLLNEAGVSKDKKVEKVKLEKKSLSGDDIKHGMGGIASKAQACYAGTQGTASVKLTVSNDGKVQKVSVSGTFANTPVGECVANAVRSASFPAWEGGPQSFGYSYLLSE
ncbi:MAG: hypothetical protein NT062_02615 [Proteobacteria bacterium]|nr:hypothetical protein [Pseudomonadota bacterium]